VKSGYTRCSVVFRRLLFALAAVGACGGHIASAPSNDGGADASTSFPSADYASGSRLRAQTYRTADGDAIFHGWFDTKLNVACTFQIADDGILRCLPAPQGYEVVYSDTSCSDASFALDHNVVDPTGPRYAVLSSCAGASAFLLSGAPVGAQTLYAPTWNGACVGIIDDFPTFSILHQDASIFVAAHATTKPVDAILGGRIIAADDGAFETSSAYDIVHGDECDLGDPSLNSTSICAPPETAYPFESCSPALVAPACANALPAALRTQSGCAASAATATLSAQSCFPSGHVTVTTGDPFDPPPLKQTVQGTSRLQKRWITSGTGIPIRVAGLHDSLLDVDCHAAMYGGAMYCLPDFEGVSVIRYTDCSEVEPAIIANACWTPKYAMVNSPPRIFVKGAPLEIGAKVCTIGEGCVCDTYDGSFAAYHSTVVSIDTFAQLEDVTE